MGLDRKEVDKVWSTIETHIQTKRRKKRVSLILGIAGLFLAFLAITANSQFGWKTYQTFEEPEEFTLSDGSVLILNRKSKIRFRQSLVNASRNTELLYGEVLFDVAHNAQVPFLVKVEDLNIKVLGTYFNVHHSPESSAEVYVMDGRVSLKGKKELFLEKGEIGSYDFKAKSLRKSVAVNENSVAWHFKELVFNDTPFADVANRIEQTFRKKIIYPTSFLKCRMNSKLKFTDEKQVLDVISQALSAEYRIEENSIHFLGDGCK